jgi:hypothetical protein
MNKLLLLVSALSALTNASAMVPVRPAKAADFIRPGLVPEFLALCCSEDCRPSDAFRLCKHINFTKVCQDFTPALDHYFVMGELQDFLNSLNDRHELRSHTQRDRLKRSLRMENWEQLLNCTQLEALMTIILDLTYLKRIDADLLTRHLTSIDELILNRDNNLRSSFDLAELKAILCQLLDGTIEPGTSHTTTRILFTIRPTTLIESYYSNDPFIKHIAINGLFRFFSTLMLLESRPSDEQIRELLIGCISWKSLLSLIPSLLRKINPRFDTLTHPGNIQTVIRAFQEGTNITQEQLVSCFDPHAFRMEGIAFSWITGQINFHELAHALNELRRGRAVDLSRICDPELLRRAGLDIDRATDPHRPLAARIGARFTILNQMIDMKACNTIKHYMIPACIPVLLWLGIQALCPTCLKYLTPPQIVAQLMTLFLAWVLLMACERFENPSFVTRLESNTAAFALASYIGLHELSELRKRQPLIADIEENIRSLEAGHRHKAAELALRELVTSLTTEQVKLLPITSDLSALLNNPRAFILDEGNERFISKLPATQLDRLAMIAQTVQPPEAPETLSTHAAYSQFADRATNAVDQLSCPSMLRIARFNPRLLARETRFLRALDPETYGQFEALCRSVAR